MFSGRTPAVLRDLWIPERRAEIILSFQRAWIMPIRRGEPGVVRGWLWRGGRRRRGTVVGAGFAGTFDCCHFDEFVDAIDWWFVYLWKLDVDCRISMLLLLL